MRHSRPYQRCKQSRGVKARYKLRKRAKSLEQYLEALAPPKLISASYDPASGRLIQTFLVRRRDQVASYVHLHDQLISKV